ncbi:MAG: hypothetical protein Q7S31_00695, partial [bacterium]|nr:hypothetical protein [bacterium]
MSSLKGSFLLFILLQLFLFIPSPVLASDIIDSWTQDSPLTQPIANHPSFSFGNYLYTLGGSTSDDFSLIQRLDIFSSGPSRIWSHISDLNEPLYWHAAILKSNRAYTIGGTQYPPQTSVNSSKSATINGSGTISLWIPTTPLPQRLSKGVAAISGNYIYFAGGWTDSEGVGSASNKVYYAPINLDGTLGSWNTTTDLPGVYWSHRMVESNGFLYILGGFKNGSRTSDVIRAQVNSVDGTLSGWTNMLPLPNDIESFGVVRIEDYIITVAGGSTAGLTKKVYYSQINNDGSLAGWQTSAA